MGIYKPIKLTVDGYKLTMSDSIDLYVGDRVTLQFELYKLAVATRFGAATRTTDIQPLTAILYIETPDGRDVMEAADIIDNLVEFNLSEYYTQNIGVSRLQLRLFDDNGDRITLPEFTFNVKESIYGDQVTKINLCLADENRNAIVDEKDNRIATPTRALNVAVNKQIQSFDEKMSPNGNEDILIQDSGITKRIKVDSLLAQKANSNEVVKKGYGTLNDFDEETRRILLGLEQGEINAVLGVGNVQTENLANESVTNAKIAKGGVHEKNVFKNFGQLLHDGSVVIDMEQKVIRLAGDVWYYNETAHKQIAKKSEFREIDLTQFGIGESHTSFILYHDLIEGGLKFAPINTVKNPYVVFAYWYGGYKGSAVNRGINEYKIKIIEPDGREYKRDFERNTQQGMLVFAHHATTQINIQVNGVGVDDFIELTGGDVYVQYKDQYVRVKAHQGVCSKHSSANDGYVRMVYYNATAGRIDMCLFSQLATLHPNDDVYVLFTFFLSSGKPVISSMGDIPQGKVFINGNDVTYTPVKIENIGQENIKPYSLRPNRMSGLVCEVLNSGSIEVNFQELKVKVKTAHTYYIDDKGYIPFRGKGDAKLEDIDIPAEMVDGNRYTLDCLWYDRSEQVLKFTQAKDRSDNCLVLGYFYQTKAFLNNARGGIRVINRYGNKVRTSYDELVEYADTIQTLVDTKSDKHSHALHGWVEDGYIDVYPREYRVVITSNLISFPGAFKTIGGSVNSPIEISWADEPNPNYMRFIGYNLSTNQIEVKTTGALGTNTFVQLCSVYQNRLTNYLSASNFRVNGVPLVNAVAEEGVASGMVRPTFYSRNPLISITHDKENYTINVQRLPGYMMFDGHKSHNISSGTETPIYTYQASESNIHYCYRLLVNKKDTTDFLITSYGAELSEDIRQRYAYVCHFDQTRVYGLLGVPENITLNGKVPDSISQPENTSVTKYNWNENRFVIPKDLYFIKDVPYSIFAPNFNMQQMVDNDDCLFELALPTKVVQFEQTADIQIPMVFEKDKPFRTRIGGKYKGSNKYLTKDIYLHVADPKNAVKKDVTILCIGDSITNSNFPKNIKWQLQQFGFNPKMIGTVNCSHESYSYGITQYLPTEKGEGRGGWRLTDFTCTTPLVNGGTYINSSFPMMNPSTQKFDFSYYMQSQGFDGVDFIIINLGTNDMSGYHYAGSTESNSAYKTIRKVDLDGEYLNPESEFYLAKQYKILIDSIHAYDPNIKIMINPPMTSGISAFVVNSMKWAEVVQHTLKDEPNVYMGASYLGQGQLSTCTIEGKRSELTKVDEKNETLSHSSILADVHVNGMGQLIHSLYPASWIVNMCQ